MHKITILIIALFLFSSQIALAEFAPQSIQTKMIIKKEGGTIDYPNPDESKDEATDMVNSLFYIDNPEDASSAAITRYKQISNASNSIKIKTTFDNKILYVGIVDKTTESNLDIFNTIKASLSNDEKLKTSYETIATIKLDESNIPWASLEEFANNNTSTASNWYYARQCTVYCLSTEKFKKFTKGGSITGIAFLSNGSYYYNDNLDSKEYHYKIILKGFPLSLLLKKNITNFKKISEFQTLNENSFYNKITDYNILKNYKNNPTVKMSITNFDKIHSTPYATIGPSNDIKGLYKDKGI